MRVIYFICVAFISIIISSCSYKQNQALFESNASLKNAADTSSAGYFPAASEYRIRPLDILMLRNLQNIRYIVDEVPTGPNGNSGSTSVSQGQSFTVEEDGTVALPVIGRIPIAGLTRVQAMKKIEELYKKDLLKDPIIDVKITNLKVTLFGEVRAPGNIPLVKDNTTLVELLGEAGGLTPSGDEKRVKIIRSYGKEKRVTEIDLSNINSITDPRAVLQNGDIIYVAQNRRAIRIDKTQTLNTFIQPALLVLNTALILFTLTRL